MDGQPEDPNIIEEGLTVMGYYQKDSFGIDQFVSWIVVTDTPGLEGSHIVEARPETDPNSLQPIVNFRMDAEGGTIFQQLTSENINKFMAVTLGGKVKAYASITEAIPGGSAIVRGFDYDQANNLATVLRTGSLPVQLDIRTLQSVGSSLGSETIQAGLRAILIGFAAVFAFILLWYKGAGIIADLALAINLFLLTAMLSSFNLTLTMTSIAGLILTVGMSVDANVIIFERIKGRTQDGERPCCGRGYWFQKSFLDSYGCPDYDVDRRFIPFPIGQGAGPGFCHYTGMGDRLFSVYGFVRCPAVLRCGDRGT